MTVISRLLLCAVLAGLTAPSIADDTKLNVSVVDQYIVPTYRQLAIKTSTLKQQATRFCRNPSAEQYQILLDSYHGAMSGWQDAQLIRFGPIEFLLRGNRYQLWPDKRGQVAKHLRRLILKQDPAALERERFVPSSVAVQGFSALEQQLFAKQGWQIFANPTDGSYRCDLVKTIALNIEIMSKGLVYDWVDGEEQHRQYILTASKGNDFYESDREVSSKILNNLYTQLQFIVDQKLDRPLGSSLQKARGKRAESWRSRRSLENIKHNLNSVRVVYQLGIKPLLKDIPMALKIESEFDLSLSALTKIKRPLYSAATDAEERTAVLILRTHVNQLKQIFSGSLPTAVNLPLGFNSLDGD